MALDLKYQYAHTSILRDGRPLYVRIGDWLMQPDHSLAMFMLAGFSFHFNPALTAYADFIFITGLLYMWWLQTRDRSLAFRMPLGAKHKDTKSRGGKAKGILYLGNMHPSREEVWFEDSDARTHMLYLGTTGSGKTEGLKSMATNAMCWASGFVYIDGKADTDLWSSLSSLVRRFGRDDDLLVLNYMTGNSNRKAPSNSMNPFSTGSASYLTQMLVSLMPEAEGDNAMWKERAVSLLGALMPALTWKRDNQDIGMSVGTIRTALTLQACVKLSRDESLPEMIRRGLKGYLETLPGYVDAAFDDDGKDKPMGPDQPMIDTTTAKTQHGYLSMQFTRSLQSLADDYGYIFDSQAADVDMLDVVLNRRILVVLIPALEKSGDETANLGKIVAATLKGMMGSTLGSTVEGESSTVIENKPTNSATPFMTIFDEVGYYASQGMGVMAAQARSLGFSLLFSAQDLPAMEKRVKEEARSIAANCNIKIFGKLEDPTQTKEFFEKTVGTAFVTEVSGFQTQAGSMTRSYHDNFQAGVQDRKRANYDAIRAQKEGEAVIAFGDRVVDIRMFYSNPGFAKAMRVTRYMPLPPPDENLLKHNESITKLRDLMVKKGWSAARADVSPRTPAELNAMNDGFNMEEAGDMSRLERGILGVVSLHALNNSIDVQAAPVEEASSQPVATKSQAPSNPMSTFAAKPATPVQAPADQNMMNIELDEETKAILANAAGNARKEIFKSEKETPRIPEDAAE
ncbi:MAG: type IV secretion protein IcmO [Micavibrio aeruginosavorus]|uniref:Type IV secretion protein IcmO n=1 Tax=Micavibrio aeruginosavorus TaxID=349221 RepID=A0A2W5FUC7_9BACT|nr:MAG: type IV secretion protein IcmO [Micavibrio aeruginosavorus]